MKPSARAVFTMTAIAAMAVIWIWMSQNHVAAQQKKITTPDLVRNVDEPGFNAFEVELTTSVSIGGFTVFFPVPTNMLAVVEHVSLSGDLPTGQVAQAFVRCEVPPADAFHEASHALVLVPQGSVNGNTWYAASQPMKCFASSGESSLSIHLQSFPNFVSGPIWQASVSGYLVPAS